MKISDELLRRYISGECTEEERQFVERWMNSEEGVDSELSEREVSQIEQNIRQRIEKSHPFLLTKTSKTNWKQITRYAAAIAVFLMLGASTYFYLNLGDNQTIATVVSWEGYSTYETQRGERPSILLHDGSTVQLNSESRLKYPENFTDTERVVFLEGHAHFNVTKNPDKPFVIYTEHSKTQVLGTSFDVKTNHKHGETEVIVTSGQVAFSEKDEVGKPVLLRFNDRAILSADGNIFTDKVDALTLTAWTKNQLVFENQTLGEIMRVAEGWFDINVLIEDTELENKSFTYAAENPSLEEFLEFMGEVANFEFHLANKDVTIVPSSLEEK
ncbi:MAG: FecR domain-containing protein [Bacteroidota bacterium]